MPPGGEIYILSISIKPVLQTNSYDITDRSWHTNRFYNTNDKNIVHSLAEISNNGRTYFTKTSNVQETVGLSDCSSEIVLNIKGWLIFPFLLNSSNLLKQNMALITEMIGFTATPLNMPHQAWRKIFITQKNHHDPCMLSARGTFPHVSPRLSHPFLFTILSAVLRCQ